MLPRMVMVLLALCLLGTASPAADDGFLSVLAFVAISLVALHIARLLRASPATATGG